MPLRRMMIALSLSIAAGLWAACSQSGDLNKACVLVTKDAGDPTGRTPADLLESQIPNTHTDFISFGSPDCDNLVCVRDANYPRGDAGDVAMGYCSAPCDPGVSAECQSFDGNNTGPNALTCRPLLLDTQTLHSICSQDAGACQEYFSNTSKPFFCARGGTPDGGADGG